jgi:hypothetical protein
MKPYQDRLLTLFFSDEVFLSISLEKALFCKGRVLKLPPLRDADQGCR